MSNTAKCMAGLVLFSLAGCYNTNNLKNGGLVCGKDSACPDGYVCRSDGHCWKNGTGTDAGTPVTACTTGKAPYGPFAGCSVVASAAGSTCDPVCQAGCPCNHRCIADPATYSDFLCEATASTGTTFVQPLGSCTLDNADPCAPGSLCVLDDVCAGLCYKTCRQNSDCPTNSRCTRTGLVANGAAVANLYFCSPPIEACNPTGSAACLTPRSNFNCVFLAGLTGVGNTDATTCDCVSLHSNKVGDSCTAVPDNCAPGSACVDGLCRRLCNQKGTGVPCPSGGCTAIYGSTQYGYCR